MRYKIASAILFLFAGISLVCVGVGFAGYAILIALVPKFGMAGASALAAVLLLAFPALGIGVLSYRTRRSWSQILGTNAMPTPPDNVTLTYLASLAKDRPLIAILLAALLGAASVTMRDPK